MKMFVGRYTTGEEQKLFCYSNTNLKKVTVGLLVFGDGTLLFKASHLEK